MVWHAYLSYTFTCLWYGFPWDGMAYVGTVIAWFGIGNSGMDIAGVRVDKVWQETLLTAPLLFPTSTLLHPSLGYLPSVLGLLWVHTDSHYSQCCLFCWYLVAVVR